ncbi:MAG: glucosidase, partial [Anaerolineae bacterium]|nr:glucosidase [Anaerolineae bacterium]
PPVHAWAAYFIYWNERELHGQGDLDFLKRIFQKLLLNFTWWVNRKDTEGNNVFEGGFLGLDNIGVFDRSAPLPMGGRLDQADGTAWMAFYCQMMLEIALELAMHDRAAYEELACKFYEHFLWIVAAMDRIGVHEDELWDEEDGFFYDVLRFPDGRGTRLKVRSLVGLLSLAVSTVITSEMPEKLPDFMQRVQWYNENRPELVAKISGLHTPGVGGRRLLAILDDTKLRQVLAYMLDENEFLSDYGIRALSRYHLDHPYIFSTNWGDYRVDYEPAESTTGLFGGNSNWRGPIWMPMNALLIRGLISLYGYYGDDFQVECPTGSGRMMNLWQVSQEISRRLTNIFVRNDQGRRPVYGDTETFQTDPHWRDYILFYEYFHGDNGAGIGASHQTGWTGLVAKLIQLFGDVSEADLKDGIDKEDLIHRVEEAVPN